MATEFNLIIGNTDYTDYLAYPVVIQDTKLDESLSIAEVNLEAMPDAEPIRPNRVSVLEIQDQDFSGAMRMILLNDSITKMGARNLYNHKLQLIEATYRLQATVLPDITITRVEGKYEPTLLDVAQKLLDVSGLSDIQIDGPTAALLDSIESPEWTFTRHNVLEAMRLVMNYEARVVPFMPQTNLLGHVTYSNDENDTTQFVRKASAYDPETYKTSLYTPATNMVSGDRRQDVIEPKGGWTTVRGDGDVINADNMVLHTRLPIYKIQELFMKMDVIYSRNTLNEGILYTRVPMEDIGFEKFFNLSSFTVEEQVYRVLPNTTNITVNTNPSPGDRYLDLDLGMGSSLFYQQSDNEIGGFSDIAPSKWRWAPNAQTIGEIIEWLGQRITNKPYEGSNITGRPMIKADYVQEVRQQLQAAFEAEHGTPTMFDDSENLQFIIPQYDYTGTASVTTPSTADLLALEFRIKYTPLINTSLFSYRPLQNGDGLEMPTAQFYNQSGTVISSSALGELHRRVLASGIGKQDSLTFVHHSYTDTFTTGTKSDDYTITNATHTINRHNTVSDYMLNQYEHKLNKTLSVLEEYRQFAVPNENIVERETTIDAFIKASRARNTDNTMGVFDIDMYMGDESSELRTIQFTGVDNTVNYILPAVSYAFNNSVVVTAKTESNNVVGYSSEEGPESSQRNMAPVVFTDSIGRLTNITHRVATTYTGSWDLDASNSYPEVASGIDFDEVAWSGAKAIHKDARESLSLTYQFHHVSQDPKIHFTSEWSKSLGFTGGRGIKSFSSVILSEKPINDKIDGIVLVQGPQINSVRDVRSVKLTPTSNSSSTTGKAWGITDGTRLVMWVDEEVPSSTKPDPVYLNFESVYGEWETPSNFYRVVLETNVDTNLQLNSNYTGVVIGNPIDRLIKTSDSVLIRAPEVVDGRTFQAWVTFGGSLFSYENEITIDVANDYYLRAAYHS